MIRSVIKYISPVLALLLAGGLFVQVQTYAAQDDSTPFHAGVREAVDRIPVQIGAWDGIDVSVPPAAGKLLRPNALFCRQYQDHSRGRRASVLLVHCRDSRDMTGHYPPVCYPGHGWSMQSGGDVREYEVWGRPVPMARYEFSRIEVNRFVQCVIYNFFILPRAGLATDMGQVAREGGNHRARAYGAAQVQVIFDATMPEQERLEALNELLTPLGPVIELLQSGGGGTKP